MDQQNRGSGLPSYVQPKRKRGRPRKYQNLIPMENRNRSGNKTIPVENTSGNKTVDDSMVGKTVTGVVEGTFGAGYLLNVKVVEHIDGPSLRGVVFEPGQVNPVTPENDVAPHLKMIKRTELPIPPLPNTQTEVHGSVPSPMHASEENLPATEINSGISVSVEKDLPKNETSILSVYEAEINSGISVSVANELPRNETCIIRSEPNIMSKRECDKTDKQGDALHELDVDTSTEVKESSADVDGEATRDYSRPASDSISLVQTTEDTDKELSTEQQGMPSVHQLDQLVHEEPVGSNVETPASAGPESMQSEDSEQISKSVGNNEEKQGSPKTDLLDTKTETDLPIVSASDCTTANPSPK